MAQGATDNKPIGRELGQLLRLHERLLRELMEVRDELVAPTTRAITSRVYSTLGTSPDAFGAINGAVEEAIRALKLSESNLRKDMDADHEQVSVDGIDNMPPRLSRFLAERSQNPHFSYDVIHDENRGWIIVWKEHTSTGRVRGSGQFYERPYAWLED